MSRREPARRPGYHRRPPVKQRHAGGLKTTLIAPRDNTSPRTPTTPAGHNAPSYWYLVDVEQVIKHPCPVVQAGVYVVPLQHPHEVVVGVVHAQHLVARGTVVVNLTHPWNKVPEQVVCCVRPWRTRGANEATTNSTSASTLKNNQANTGHDPATTHAYSPMTLHWYTPPEVGNSPEKV